MQRTIGQLLADENFGLKLTAWETSRLRRFKRRDAATVAGKMRAVHGAALAARA